MILGLIGTIASLVRSGIEVQYLVLTNGDKGTCDGVMWISRCHVILIGFVVE